MHSVQNGLRLGRTRVSTASRTSRKDPATQTLPSKSHSHTRLSLSQTPAFSYYGSKPFQLALQFRFYSTRYTTRTTSNATTLHRQYASSGADSGATLLEGKTEGTISSLWSKYKLYALGAGGAIAAVGLLGVAASAVAVGGIASIAGAAYMWYKSKVSHQQNVLRTLYEPLIEKSRPDIERFIGPFELPVPTNVAADSDNVPTATGGTDSVIRNVFYLDGKYGKALVRALGVKQEDGSFKLRKLIIDVQDFRRTMHDKITLVDEASQAQIVDAVKFEEFKLTDFVEVKRAAKHAERKNKQQATKKETLSSQNPTKKTKKTL